MKKSGHRASTLGSRALRRLVLAGVVTLTVVGLSAGAQAATTVSTSGAHAAAADAKRKPAKKKPVPYLTRLIAAAKREGTVTWYTAIPVSTSQPVADAFTKRYGIKVELFNVSSGPLADRYASERDIDTVNADVVNLTDPVFFGDGTSKGWFVRLSKANVPNLAAVPAKFVRLGTNVVVSIQSVGIAYNTNLVNPPPTRWEDLLDPRFQGRILLTDPSLVPSWMATYKLWQDRLAGGFLTKLAAQRPSFVSSANPGAQQIAAGEKWINTPSSPRALVAVQNAGAPVAYVVPEPTTIQESSQAISTAAKHPNAARLFMNWILSREGQQVLNRETAIAVIPNVPGTLEMPKKYFLPDIVGAERQKARLLAPFGR